MAFDDASFEPLYSSLADIDLSKGLLSLEKRGEVDHPTRKADRGIGGVPDSFRPQRERNHNEVEITFYCARERLDEMMQYRHVFGDADFTRSLSRFLTAGCHWMNDHQAEVGAAQAMATEVKLLEQQRDALRETIKRLALPAPRPWWRRLLGR